MSHSRNIRWSLYLQVFSQLEVKYDKNVGIIKNNCTNTIYLILTDVKTVQEIQERLDQKSVVTHSISAISDDMDSNHYQNINSKPIMYRSELLKIPFEKGVVIRSGKAPIQAKTRAAYRYMNLEKRECESLFRKKQNTLHLI